MPSWMQGLESRSLLKTVDTRRAFIGKLVAIKECRVETPQSSTDITAIDHVVSGVLARLCSIVCGSSHTNGFDIDGKRTKSTHWFIAFIASGSSRS